MNPLLIFTVGTKVVAVKTTRHGLVVKGTLGKIVDVNYLEVEPNVKYEVPDAIVQFDGQSIRHRFPIDNKIGTKIQVVTK